MYPPMASPKSNPPTWTRQEDKLLEMLLCKYPPGCSRRWDAIAAHLSGKTAMDAWVRYQDMVADMMRILEGPVVDIPPEWEDEERVAAADEETAAGEFETSDGNELMTGRTKKRKCGGERKKPEKWSAQEHIAFLEGLRRAGKGDWKTISRDFVPTKTASQIASHSQKYHIRQEKKMRNESKRKSIHDITDPDIGAAGHTEFAK